MITEDEFKSIGFELFRPLRIVSELEDHSHLTEASYKLGELVYNGSVISYNNDVVYLDYFPEFNTVQCEYCGNIMFKISTNDIKDISKMYKNGLRWNRF